MISYGRQGERDVLGRRPAVPSPLCGDAGLSGRQGAARRARSIRTVPHLGDHTIFWGDSGAHRRPPRLGALPGLGTSAMARLAALDACLASDAPLHAPPEKIFQGPVADALTHVGQIATRHALAGAPVRG